MLDEERNQEMSPKETAIGCLVLLIIAVIIILVVRGCVGGKEEPANEAAGLGVSRDMIIASLAEQGYAFSGEETTTDGEVCWSGASTDGLAILELSGPKDDLASVNVVFGIPAYGYTESAQGMLYMFLILEDIFPQWDKRADWIIAAVDQVVDGKDMVNTTRDCKYVEFRAVRDMGLYGLKVVPVNNNSNSRIDNKNRGKVTTAWQ